LAQIRPQSSRDLVDRVLPCGLPVIEVVPIGTCDVANTDDGSESDKYVGQLADHARLTDLHLTSHRLAFPRQVCRCGALSVIEASRPRDQLVRHAHSARNIGWKVTIGGEGGIRTLGTGITPYRSLANFRTRPLCDLPVRPWSRRSLFGLSDEHECW